MTIQKFMETIKQAYNKHFPASLCVVRYDSSLYASIGISCYLTNDITECPHNIRMNDPLHFSLSIDHNGKPFSREMTAETEMPENLLITIWHNNYKAKPDDQYHVFSSRKIPCRKTSGNAEKLITTMDRWFGQLKTQLQTDLDNDMIHKDHIELMRLKLA